MTPTVQFHTFNDALCIKIVLDKPYWYELRGARGNSEEFNGLLFFWILNKLKPFFRLMPLDALRIEGDKATYQKHKRVIDHLSLVLHETNEIIHTYKDLKDTAEGNRLLFWNISDNPRYKALYDKLKKTNPDIIYWSFYPGFDQKKREWTDVDIPMPLDELIDTLQKENIKKIISINHYIPDKYLFQSGAHLLALLDYMGIEWIIIDNDPPDLRPAGYLAKAFFNNISHPRFSNFSVLSEWWDSQYHMNNVHYVALPGNYEKAKPIDLEDDFDIIVLSNSRYDSLRHMEYFLNIFWDNTPKENLVDEIGLWYLASLKLVLDVMEITDIFIEKELKKAD